MKNSRQTARKKNKDPNCGQAVITESPKRRSSDLGKKVKPKKLKCLVKGTGSENSSDLELLRDTKKKKMFKKEKDRKLPCIQIQNSDGRDEGQPGTDFHVSKKCDKIVFEVGRQEEASVAKRKKKKKEKRKDVPLQQKNNLAPGSEDSEAIRKKKQLNKISPASLSCLAKIQENHCDVMSEHSLKCGPEKEAGVGEAPKEVKKAKKGVKRETGGISCFSEAGQDTLLKVGAPGGKEKRKKAKKHKVERGDRDGFEGSQEQQIKKKRKNKEIENSQEGGKKAKKEKETKKQIPEDEIKLVAFRKGNCDEVKIDKVRRQALQEEIDRESGKTKIAKEGSDNRLGQWSTATFETPEQKAKFHRLMGGFKKGFCPAQSSPAKAIKPNMALDQPREQELQQNLEAEFKKAVDFKHHRGIGLGFQPSAPSGVHIDKYASKSIKFEA